MKNIEISKVKPGMIIRLWNDPRALIVISIRKRRAMRDIVDLTFVFEGENKIKERYSARNADEIVDVL